MTGGVIRISGGSCFIRAEPRVTARILGVAVKGSELPFGGSVSENGWLMTSYRSREAWVSGRYGKLS